MPSIREKSLDLTNVIQRAFDIKASDVHLAPGKPMMMRIDGEIKVIDEEPIAEEDTYAILENCLSNDTRTKFNARKSYDVSVEIDKTRARIHFHEALRGVCVSCRLVPLTPKTLDELMIPPIVEKWGKTGGIIIISGLANMGKTTTIASIVDYINSHRAEKIMILEDPVEYLHKDKKSFIFQREVGTNSPSYADALKDILREDVNTVIVGEVRNAQAMDAVFGMAENGLKVVTSLHAPSAVETVERIVNMFPPSDYERIYKRLSWTLSGILNQWLVPKRKGGRVLSCEILTNNEAICNLLREGKIQQIRPYLDKGTDEICSREKYDKKLESKGIM
jgi:twitching motility protein PilT